MAARRQGPGAGIAEAALRADFDLRRLFDALRPRSELRVPVRRPDALLVSGDSAEGGLARPQIPAEERPDRYGGAAAAALGTRAMAGRSRFAFTMPPGVTSLPFTLPAVLEAMSGRSRAPRPPR